MTFKGEANFEVNHDWFFRGRHGVACTEQYCVPPLQHVFGVGLHADPCQRRADQKPWLWLVWSNLGLPSVAVDCILGDAMRVLAVPAALMLRAAG